MTQHHSRRSVLAAMGAATVWNILPKSLAAAEPSITTGSETALAAAQGLLRRVVPDAASAFRLEVIAPDDNNDVFEVESIGSSVILRGNNAISLASALHHYLKYFCRRQMSWWDRKVEALPSPLPKVQNKVRCVAGFKHRVYLNYCTFSYTAAWWDWERWQREIDWMAMRGINMPLVITGQEAVWQNMLRNFRMNDEEIRQFICGPAFLAWQWMANLEGWAGPLPQSWIDSHTKLGQQILAREREFGMTPILQGFTGFVPRAIKAKYPDARIQLKPNWCNVFPGTAQLDPLDPLFREMGTTFLREQQKLFGTDHIYAADPFHESKPPSDSPDYLPAVADMILKTMQEVDPKARIAMQTWSLRKPLVTNIPKDRILLLALTGAGWDKNEGFWDRPWVCGVLPNYGGRIFMAGDLNQALDNALSLRKNTAAGRVEGIGLFPEATQQNPIYYDAAAEVAWMRDAPNADEWLQKEIASRYGSETAPAQEAWSILHRSLYSKGTEAGSVESPICSRPALFIDRAAPNAGFKRHYDPTLVWDGWQKLQEAARALKGNRAFEYDLVDLGRQALADLSIPLQRNITAAYLESSPEKLKLASERFLDLASDMDTLLATREEFLLGKWIKDAKLWATNAAEQSQYEWNARLQVSVWGPSAPDAFLFDYANKQWSGLIRGYYVPRWKMFLDYLASQPQGEGCFSGKDLKLEYNRPADESSTIYKQLSQMEQAWSRKTDTYASQPAGDSIKISQQLLNKWAGAAKIEFKRYNLQHLS